MIDLLTPTEQIAAQQRNRVLSPERRSSNVFHNRTTGHTIRINGMGVFFGCLLAGPFFFAIVGEWGHALFALGLALLSWGASGFIYPFFANAIVKHKWLTRGYIQS